MEALDTLVRRVDEDRWLATRFAPADVRARLIALYAVNYEIARIGETVREPGLGEVRLQWWRDGVDEVFDGGSPRSHPALAALKQAVNEAPLSRARFHTMLDARRLDFERTPFKSWEAFADYIDGTSGALVRLAIEACGVTIEAGPVQGFATSTAYYWAVSGILRSERVWRARGRDLIPPGPRTHSLFERLKRGVGSSRRLSRQVPTIVFPAVGYAALMPAYLGRKNVRETAPLFERQLRLVLASATGCI